MILAFLHYAPHYNPPQSTYPPASLPATIACHWMSLSRWNKYTQIASRAVRQALNETDRVAAEKRAQIGV